MIKLYSKINCGLGPAKNGVGLFKCCHTMEFEFKNGVGLFKRACQKCLPHYGI